MNHEEILLNNFFKASDALSTVNRVSIDAESNYFDALEALKKYFYKFYIQKYIDGDYNDVEFYNTSRGLILAIRGGFSASLYTRMGLLFGCYEATSEEGGWTHFLFTKVRPTNQHDKRFQMETIVDSQQITLYTIKDTEYIQTINPFFLDKTECRDYCEWLNSLTEEKE